MTAYGGGAADLPGDVLQAFINSAEAGHAYVPVDKVFKMDQIAAAHAYMVSHFKLNEVVCNAEIDFPFLKESGKAVGKLVVETGM